MHGLNHPLIALNESFFLPSCLILNPTFLNQCVCPRRHQPDHKTKQLVPHKSPRSPSRNLTPTFCHPSLHPLHPPTSPRHNPVIWQFRGCTIPHTFLGKLETSCNESHCGTP
ncbi:hypothetical protein CDAR_320191 [Caerostris darwini]|uniref:Uncharacterized protein n=1 Tax=Caerostris darwini TaxID=1538125 RepID=A0AAV4PJJ6_9ARAC|nr:hypothetical protein CDAR_320191 [Caerostris darwini]